MGLIVIKNSSRNQLFKCFLLSSLICTALPMNTFASTPAILDSANLKMVTDIEKNVSEAHDLASGDCSDPNNEGSLASKQQEIIQEQKEIASKSTDLSKLFTIGKNNGCFAALADFPDLSVSIPSLADIFTKLQKTLADYAVRKVCNAVDEAFESAVGPLYEKMDNLSSSGQLDLSGRVNKAITKKMYEVDPELGRVSGSAKAASEIEFKW